MKKFLLLVVSLIAVIGSCCYFHSERTTKKMSAITLVNVEAISQSEYTGWRKDEAAWLEDEVGFDDYFECCLYEIVVCSPKAGEDKSCQSKDSRKCEYIKMKDFEEHQMNTWHGDIL